MGRNEVAVQPGVIEVPGEKNGGGGKGGAPKRYHTTPLHGVKGKKKGGRGER